MVDEAGIIAVTVSTVVFVLMVLTGFGSGIIDVIAGGAVLTPRDASEQLMYGLFLPDAMSLFQGIPFFGEGFNKYYAMMRQFQNTTGFFECKGSCSRESFLRHHLLPQLYDHPLIEATAWS